MDRPPPDHRFDELGWLVFQQLCDELLEADLGIDPSRFRGGADLLRVQTLDDPLDLPGRETPLPAPAFVQVMWLPRGSRRERRNRFEAIAAAATEHVAIEPSGTPRAYVLAVNERLAPAREQRLDDEAGPQRLVLGPDELGEAIGRHPEIRLAVPALLGITRPEMIGRAVAHRSTLDRGAAEALARVFVATGPYREALATLERQHVAVLTGPPEMGKTAIARTIAHARMTLGWEAYECTRPEELWRAYDPGRPQVFVADDAFGSTEYRPDAAERWARELDRVIGAMDETHHLIWTSRPAPLHAGLRRLHRERGLEHFPSPSQVEVDATALTVEEKAMMLLRHARAAGAEGHAPLLRTCGSQIVEHPHFTPERVRRFVAGPLRELGAGSVGLDEIKGAVDRAVAEPTEAMARSFAALDPAERALLVAMLDAPPGPVPERDLLRTMRRHRDAVDRAPADLVDRLTDHFVRVVP